MPRKTRVTVEILEARSRLFKARAEKMEAEVAALRERFVEPKQIETQLRAFGAAIADKIRQSQLGSELKQELLDDLLDLPRRVRVGGSNGKAKRQSPRARSKSQ